MQIKDLSVKEEQLAEVRGGIGDVTGTIIDDSYNKNDADVRVGGGAVNLSGGIEVSQLLDARKEFSLSMPVHQRTSTAFSVDIADSAFNIGFPW
jgi:hypothetical protein